RQLSLEQRRQQNMSFVQEMDNKLINEVIDSQVDQIAEDIKMNMWKDNIGSVKPAGQVDVTIRNDGTVTNRSRHGVTLSYTHDDIQEYWVHKKGERSYFLHEKQEIKEEIVMGIGYFIDRSGIIPEAQQAVTNEDLQKGVKAYFVQVAYEEEKIFPVPEPY